MSREFDEELKLEIADVEAALRKALPGKDGHQKTIFEAMEYSLMAGGKRLRPIFIKESYEFFGGANKDLVEPFMVAMEMIHTYSLIHDDLPAMDNDDYRRGRLTSHKVFGEDMAILAGDALLNYAFEVALKAFDNADSGDEFFRVANAMKILAHKAGVRGMIGGQVVDVELTGKPISEEILGFIFELKTGALIQASMMIGAVLAGASKKQVDKMQQVAHCIGMAFQIQDDILDVTATTEQLGKPVHSDEKNEKTTWVSLHGLDKARQDVRAYSDAAMNILEELYEGADVRETFLYRLLGWLINREY